MKTNHSTFKKVSALFIAESLLLGALPDAILANDGAGDLTQEISERKDVADLDLPAAPKAEPSQETPAAANTMTETPVDQTTDPAADQNDVVAEQESVDQDKEAPIIHTDLPEEGVAVEVKNDGEHQKSEEFVSPFANLSEDAVKDKDGNYTWTEQSEVPADEKPTDEELEVDTSKLEFLGESEPTYIKNDKGDIIAEEVTTTYKLDEHGSTYTVTHRKHYVFDENGVRIEDEDKLEEDSSKPSRPGNDADRTPTKTTTPEKVEHTVTPGTVTVKMDASKKSSNTDADAKPILPEVHGATVVVKNGENGKYNANITLHLSAQINPDLDNVKLLVTVPGKDPQEVSFKYSPAKDGKTDYILDDIEVEDGKEIQLSLTGQQIQQIAEKTEQAVEAVDKNKAAGWAANFLYSDGKTGLGDAGWFDIFAKTYTAGSFDTNANVAVNKLIFSEGKQVIGIGDHLKSEGGTDKLDYSYRDLSYIGSFDNNGHITIQGNQNDLLKNGSHLILGDGYTVKDTWGDSKSFSVTKKEKGKEIAVTISGNKEEKVWTAENPIDFDHAMEKLTDYAKTLQQEKDTTNLVRESEGSNHYSVASGSTKIGDSNVRVVSIGIDVLTSSKWSGNDIIFQNLGDAVEKVLVNVTGLENYGADSVQNIFVNNRPNNNQDTWSPNNSNILFNFGDYNGTLNFQNKTWYGSVLAPMANVLMCSPQAPFNGKVIANSVTRGNNEQHDSGANWSPNGEEKPGKDENTNPSELTTKKISEELVVVMTVNTKQTQHSQKKTEGKYDIRDFTQSYFTVKQETTDKSGNKEDTPDQPEDDKDTPDQPGDDSNTPDQPGDDSNTPHQPGDENTNPDQPEDEKPQSEEPSSVRPTTEDPAEVDEDGEEPEPNAPEVVYEVPGQKNPATPVANTPALAMNYRFHLADTGLADSLTYQTNAAAYSPVSAAAPANQRRIKLAKTGMKRAKGANTASSTGMWGYVSAMAADAGLGVLSIFGLKARKNQK